MIPAAGLGTRFLPATKAQPKEMLALVDKPAIQYVVEEAVRSGITDILIITGRGKRSLEDHFDRSFELEYYLEQAGKFDQLKEMREIAEMANIHYVRQGEPKGLGHAVSVAREHVGDQPFVVMLGDDIMHERAGVLDSMLAGLRASPRRRRGLEGGRPPRRSSFYGCATPEPIDDHLVRILDIVEKPAVESAPSNLAVMGRYVFPPSIFDALDQVQPGSGRRDPAHRRHQAAAGATRRCSAGRSATAVSTSATSSTTCGPPSSWRSNARTSDRGSGRFWPSVVRREGLA